MRVLEIRDSELARNFLLQTLLCGHVRGDTSRFFKETLGIAYELASESRPVMPLGMLADIGQLALAKDASNSTTVLPFDALPRSLATLYEDQILGKFYADSSFERASGAVARYQNREQLQALAYLIHRLQSRAKLPAVLLNPSVIRNLQRLGTERLIESAEESRQRGLLPEVTDLYEGIVMAFRNAGELVGPEDIFELESGTALGGYGQRIALRQILKVAGEFENLLKRRPIVHEAKRRRLVATRLQDEDAYPVGGFTSISTRGSIESLLHSQLVFMETDEAERPDLFDIKFLRDELLYYARDENQFLRQRRTYLFALHPNLEHARFKDADQSYQRLIYGLGLIVTLCNKMSDWLSEEALRFEIVFLKQNENPLVIEQDLMQLIFKDRISSKQANLHVLSMQEFSNLINMSSSHSLCHVITFATHNWKLELKNALLSQLQINKQPKLTFDTRLKDKLTLTENWEEIVPTLAEHLML